MAADTFAPARRLPSPGDLFTLFAACVIPTHIWILIRFFDQVPALILKWTAWQIVGHAAYLLLYVFVESVVLFLIFLVTFTLLPRRWWQGRWVVQASTAVFLTSAWLILLQSGYEQFRFGGRRLQVFWLALYIFSHLLLFLLLQHAAKLADFLRRLWDRLAVLGALYLVLDAIALVVVIIRNL